MKKAIIFMGIVFSLFAGVFLGEEFRDSKEYIREYSTPCLAGEWKKIISEKVNEKPIRLIINGENYTGISDTIYMNESRELMIPQDVVRDGFQTAVHCYQDKKLVIENGKNRAVILKNSNYMTIGKKKVYIGQKIIKRDGKWYIPLEAMTSGFSYSVVMDYSKNAIRITSREGLKDTLPEKYDYRAEGRVPEVKDQGNFGTCWAFASLTALESSLYPEDKMVFSPENMVLNNGFISDMYSGGDYTMAIAYLASWQGPVLESEDTYGDFVTPKNVKAEKHVQEVQILEPNDGQKIKQMIYQYGGVQSTLYITLLGAYSDSAYYNSEKSAYCYPFTREPNHDVVIIGWDDRYPASNFTTKVKGDGAWICRNSWGEEFGDKGTFYVSYYDSNIAVHNICYTRIEETDNYDSIYQTDLCGWVGNLGFDNKNDAYFANVYKAKKSEKLKAVSFYAPSKNAAYSIYVVDHFTGKKDLTDARVKVSEGTLSSSGYYTIPINKEIHLEAKQKFAVIVKLHTPGNTKPIAIEYQGDDMTINARIDDGEGYYSQRGEKWSRAENEEFSICLKAFTDNQ